jgi:matrixin
MRRIALGLALAAGCAASNEPIEVSADEPLPIDLHAGDIVRAGDFALEVPPAGETVTIAIDTDDGGVLTLSLATSPDGVVSVVAPPAEEPTVIAGATAPCQDGAFHLAGHKWKTNYAWHFDAGSTPNANNKDKVEAGLLTAANAITHSRNDCGLADQISATHSYAGRTTRGPNIRTTSSGTVVCGSRDNQNTVGFGALPSNFLGVACWWTDGTNAAIEGDVKLSTRHRWYAQDVPADCSNTFGVEPVATHEFGHVFGLAHVSESTHPNLTMSTAAAACSNGPLSLGLGDVRALRRLY